MNNNREEIDRLITEFQKEPSIEKINEIIEVEPSVPAFYYKADLLIQDENYDEAEKVILIGYKITEDILENTKEPDAIAYVENMQTTFVCMLDYVYSETKQYDKLINAFVYKDKTRTEVLAYIDYLGDEEKDLYIKAYSSRVIGDIQNEEKYYLEAAEKYPESFNANYNIAEFYRLVRRYQEADKYYDKALEIEPKNINAIHAKGFNLENIDMNKSLECYNKVLEIDPEAVGTLLNKGRLEGAFIKDLEAALKSLNKAIELDENLTLAYIARANAKELGGDYKGALEDANKAIELEPKIIEGYEFKAKALNRLERYEESIEVISNAEKIEKLELSGRAHYFRAAAYEFLEKDKEALEDANIAKEHGYIEAIMLLGRIYLKNKEYDKALEEVKIILNHNKSDEKAKKLLEDIKLAKKESRPGLSKLYKGLFKK